MWSVWTDFYLPFLYWCFLNCYFYLSFSYWRFLFLKIGLFINFGKVSFYLSQYFIHSILFISSFLEFLLILDRTLSWVLPNSWPLLVFSISLSLSALGEQSCLLSFSNQLFNPSIAFLILLEHISVFLGVLFLLQNYLFFSTLSCFLFWFLLFVFIILNLFIL